MIEGLILATCPKCHAANRYWHQAGVFLVTESADSGGGTGGLAPVAAVICRDCGYIELYAQSAQILQHLPEAQVQTETPRPD